MAAINQKLRPRISNRELEIIRLITNEYSSNEIAQLLFIGVETVKSHRKNIRKKLNVKNVAGVVRAAFEYRFISLTQNCSIAS